MPRAGRPRKSKTSEGNKVEALPVSEKNKPDPATDSENELNELEREIADIDIQPSSTSGMTQKKARRRYRKKKHSSSNPVPDDNTTSTDSTDQTIQPVKKYCGDDDEDKVEKSKNEQLTKAIAAAAESKSIESNRNKLQALLAQRRMTRMSASYSSDDAVSAKPKQKEQPSRPFLAEPINETSDSDAIYCLCEKVSAGGMVKCDNDICPWEWFHFKCVSLRVTPQGKWYCPRCRDEFAHRPKARNVLQQQLLIYNNEMERRD